MFLQQEQQGPHPLWDSVVRSDQLLRELGERSNAIAYRIEFLASRATESYSGSGTLAVASTFAAHRQR